MTFGTGLGKQEVEGSPAVFFVLLFSFYFFFRFTFILVRLAYFTFDTTNLSLRYGSILSKWDCKFKIVWSFFTIIFPRPSSLRKETWMPCNRGGARMRFVSYFSSLNHSLVRNKFIDITAGFARFV